MAIQHDKKSRAYQRGLKDGLKHVSEWMDKDSEDYKRKPKCIWHIFIKKWVCIDCGCTKVIEDKKQ